MLDRATTERTWVAEETSLALNGIGISPVVSGSVDLKLCLSRHAAGRIDDEFARLPVDDVDLFVPAAWLSGERWEGGASSCAPRNGPRWG